MHLNAVSIRQFLWITSALIILGNEVGFAEKVVWKTDVREAVRAARQSQKPMLVSITADWCGYCHKMLRTTFADGRIVRSVNDCFVPVILDADRDEQLVSSIGVEGLPTTVIVSPEMKVLKKITGFQSADQLQRQLDRFCRTDQPSNAIPVIPVTRSNSKTPKYSFDRHCLVSMFDDGKLKQITAEHTTTYHGKTVCFASAAYKRRFLANPAHYWPALDGNCPVSQAEQSRVIEGVPKSGLIYRGKLWFFADASRQQKFREAPASYSAQVVKR